MIGIIQRFAAIGALPDDTEDERIRKGALTLARPVLLNSKLEGRPAALRRYSSD
jgi:hypothetical protein